MFLLPAKVVCICVFSYMTCMHPLHISLTNIEYNKKLNTFDVTFKLFADDFENIIFKKYDVSLNLGKTDEREDLMDYVERYIRLHFQMTFNGEDNKALKMKYLRREMSENAIWFYFSVKAERQLSSVRIVNSLMYDLFEDQKNLVIFTYGDIQKGYDLCYKDDEIVVDL